MKTGAEGYAEVQAMGKINPIEWVGRAEFLMKSAAIFGELQFDVNGQGAFTEAGDLIGEAEDVVSAVASLIDCARTILRTGFTIEDHQRLQAILEKIA